MIDVSIHFPCIGFWSFRKDGRHALDETCCSLLGLTTPDPSFENFISTIHEEDLEIFKENYLFRLMTSWWQIPLPAQKFTFIVKIKGHGPRFVRGSCLVLRDEDSPFEVRGFLEDVTEEKLQEEKKLERLKKMALLGELGFSINHETLNPLSVISLCSGHLNTLLNRNELEREKVQSCLVIMNKAVDKTAKIIKSMRLFNEGQNQHHFEKINLKSLVEDALELCQDRMRWYDIELSIDLSPDIYLECRPIQVSQILMNLVLNSILSIKDLNKKWIKIWARDKGQAIELFVQDSGDGIPSSIASEIMKPFYSTRNGEGTGLGLYISRNYAKEHRGSLRYDPTTSHTLFILELPLSQK